MNGTLTLGGTSAASTPQAAPGTAKIGELTGPVTQPSSAGPTQAELNAADIAENHWLMYNKGYSGERYSSLRQNHDAQRAWLASCLHVSARRDRDLPDRAGCFMTDSCTSRLTSARTPSTQRLARRCGFNRHAVRGAEMNATNKGVAIAGEG